TSIGIGDVGEPSQLFKQMTNRRTDLLKEYSKSAGKFSANWTFVFAGLSTVVLLLSVFSQKSFSAEMTFARDRLCAELCCMWVPERAQNMCFRVAVREVEAWLLADRERISRFLSVPLSRIPTNPEGERDAKEVMVSLASVRETKGCPTRHDTTSRELKNR
ncbi:MAG TPA: hypothetical protein VIE89_21300, partial [Candidatus Binatia bacterium]